MKRRLRNCFILLIFSGWASIDFKCYRHEALKIRNWFEDAATKDTSCVLPQSCLDLILCQQLHHQYSATKTKVLFLANLCHGDGLCLLKPMFTLCSLDQLCKQRKGSILGRGKSLAMLNQWCFIAFIKLMCCWLQIKAIHHFRVMENPFCWAPAAVKESSSSQGHRYTINSLFTKTKCSRLAVLQLLVIKVIYLYEVFRFLKALQVNNRIKE